jgi:hypothetical protein
MQRATLVFLRPRGCSPSHQPRSIKSGQYNRRDARCTLIRSAKIVEQSALELFDSGSILPVVYSDTTNTGHRSHFERKSEHILGNTHAGEYPPVGT